MAQDGCADAWFGDSELAAEGFDNNVGSLGCFTLYSYFIGFYWLSGKWWYPWDGGPLTINPTYRLYSGDLLGTSPFTGCAFTHFLKFTPKIKGKMNPFWQVFFQRGWNHQAVVIMSGSYTQIISIWFIPMVYASLWFMIRVFDLL